MGYNPSNRSLDVSDALQSLFRYTASRWGISRADEGTVSQSLKVLEQKGLLRKQQDRQDKRIVHLAATAKGRKLVEQSIPAKGLEAAMQMTSSLRGRELEELPPLDIAWDAAS